MSYILLTIFWIAELSQILQWLALRIAPAEDKTSLAFLKVLVSRFASHGPSSLPQRMPRKVDVASAAERDCDLQEEKEVGKENMFETHTENIWILIDP